MTPKDETPKPNPPPWRQPEDEMPDDDYEAQYEGRPIDRAEMRRIAEKIARDPGSYSSAKITALRFIRELDDGKDEVARDSFAELDELAPRRGGRAT